MSRTVPLVSIIIPAFNMCYYIGDAVDSALVQTGTQTEVIVIDDGSTDGTGDFLRKKYGDRIRYVYQENQGRGAARNHGLRIARGEYVQFLDADDLLYPHKLAQHVAFLETHPEYAAVYGHSLIAWEDDLEHPWDLPQQIHYASGNILKPEIHHPFLLPIMILIRREWVERVYGFDEALRSNEDWDLWLRIAQAGGLFAHLPGAPVALQRARRCPTAKASVHLYSGVCVLTKLRQAVTDHSQRKFLEIDREIGKWRFGYGKALADEGQRREGVRQMLIALTADRRSLMYKLLTIVVMMLFSPDRGNKVLERAHMLKSRLLSKEKI